MPFMWSLCNPFYLSVTRRTTQRQRREGGREGGRREKKKKEKHASPGLAWRGWIPQENSSDKGAQTSNWRIRTLHSKDTGARTCERRVNARRDTCCVLSIAPKMCTRRQIPNLRGWGNACYLFNYELSVRSWSSESWTLISFFSSLRTQVRELKAENGWMSRADPHAFEGS